MRTSLIIGAGIGGLAAAVSLRRAGVEAIVLERAPALRTGGAGLWLWPNALHALDAIGDVVGRAVRGAGVVQTSNRVRDARGRTLVRMAVARSDGRLYRSLSIRRAALLAALAAALPPDAIRFDAAVTGVDVGDAGRRATVRLADGTALVADLVIAADGVGSAIRAALFGDSGRRDAGFTAFRAVVPFAGAANVAGGVIWGRGCRFGVLAVAEDRVNWFAGFTAPADLEPADRLAVIRAHFEGSRPMWRRGRSAWTGLCRSSRRCCARCATASWRSPRRRSSGASIARCGGCRGPTSMSEEL